MMVQRNGRLRWRRLPGGHRVGAVVLGGALVAVMAPAQAATATSLGATAPIQRTVPAHVQTRGSEQHIESSRAHLKPRPVDAAIPGMKHARKLNDRPAVVGGPVTQRECATIPSTMDGSALPDGLKPGGKLCGTVQTRSTQKLSSTNVFRLADGTRPKRLHPYKPKKRTQPSAGPSPSSPPSPSADSPPSPSAPGKSPSAGPPSTGASDLPGPSARPSADPSATGKLGNGGRAHAAPAVYADAGLPKAPVDNGDGTFLSPDWVKETTQTAPTTAWMSSMAWDPVRQQMVLFGGWGDPSGEDSNETWVWSAGTWSKLSPATKPAGRAAAMMGSVRDSV